MKPVVLPWPTKLTPNAKRRQHWRTTQRETKAAKELAWGLALAAGYRYMRGMNTPMTVKITVEPWPGTYPDQDGCIGAVKAYLDGIALALGVDDKLFRLAPIFGDQRNPGQVTIEVEVPDPGTEHGASHE